MSDHLREYEIRNPKGDGVIDLSKKTSPELKEYVEIITSRINEIISDESKDMLNKRALLEISFLKVVKVLLDSYPDSLDINEKMKYNNFMNKITESIQNKSLLCCNKQKIRILLINYSRGINFLCC